MGKKKPDKCTERIFYTFKEAMNYIAVSKYTLRKLMKSGLPSYRIGRKIVFLKEDVARWLKEH
jgi:excisionase family DNA binding protein